MKKYKQFISEIREFTGKIDPFTGSREKKGWTFSETLWKQHEAESASKVKSKIWRFSHSGFGSGGKNSIRLISKSPILYRNVKKILLKKIDKINIGQGFNSSGGVLILQPREFENVKFNLDNDIIIHI